MSTLNSIVKAIRGIVKVRGATDNTLIGNVSDSIKANITNTITSTIINTVTVSAIDLDIRNLTTTNDNVTVFQGTSPWSISGSVTGPLTDTQLRATPVPISGQVSITGSTISVTQGTNPWSISGSVLIGATISVNPVTIANTITSVVINTVTVAAVDLDIRNLTSTSDSVVAVGETGLTVTETRTTVTATALAVMASNTGRKNGYLVNSGSTNLYIGYASSVSITGANIGAILRPGGSFPLLPGYAGAVYAVGDANATSQNCYAAEIE